MPHIHERIPLVVTGAVRSHPRSHDFLAAIFDCIREVFAVSGPAVKFEGGKFHVVRPVLLLIDVWRENRGCLAATRLGNSGIVGSLSLCTDLRRQFRVERCQYLGTQGETGGELACGAGYSGGPVLQSGLSPLLRFPRTVPDRSLHALPPAVVSALLAGKPHPDVVPVICNLVVHLPRLGVHLVKPQKPPPDLVHDVRNAVGARCSVGAVLVPEGLGIAPIGKHHLVNRIGRGCGVLQAVRGIMRAPYDIQMGTVLRRIGMSDNDGVVGVAAVTKERIPAAALLTHVVEHEISGPVVDTRPHREHLGLGDKHFSVPGDS